MRLPPSARPAALALALLAACGGGGSSGGGDGPDTGGGPILPPVPPGTAVPTAPTLASPPRKTNDRTPRMAGTAGPGVLVRLYAGATLLGGALAGDTGEWEVHPSVALPDGVHPLHATAVNAAGASDPSASVTVTVDTLPPAAPSGLRVLPLDSGVDLFWTAGPEPDLRGYLVYRKGPGDADFARVTSRLVVVPRYRDTGLTNGTAYEYRVSAVDDAEDERHP